MTTGHKQQQHVDVGNETQQENNHQDNHTSGTAAEDTTGATVTGVVEEQPGGGDAGLVQRVQQAEQEAKDFKDQWLRAVADYKNYKRRAEQERAELIRSASAGLVLKLLPVIDDFERAVASVPPDIADHAWWAGTQLIAQKLRTILESEGVTAIEAEGHDFDPTLHDAVMYEETDGEDGKVTAELRKGYRLHERVLRPSMVKVGKAIH